MAFFSLYNTCTDDWLLNSWIVLIFDRTQAKFQCAMNDPTMSVLWIGFMDVWLLFFFSLSLHFVGFQRDVQSRTQTKSVGVSTEASSRLSPSRRSSIPWPDEMRMMTKEEINKTLRHSAQSYRVSRKVKWNITKSSVEKYENLWNLFVTNRRIAEFCPNTISDRPESMTSAQREVIVRPNMLHGLMFNEVFNVVVVTFFLPFCWFYIYIVPVAVAACSGTSANWSTGDRSILDQLTALNGRRYSHRRAKYSVNTHEHRWVSLHHMPLAPKLVQIQQKTIAKIEPWLQGHLENVEFRASSLCDTIQMKIYSEMRILPAESEDSGGSASKEEAAQLFQWFGGHVRLTFGSLHHRRLIPGVGRHRP